jgi:hypothetical protein
MTQLGSIMESASRALAHLDYLGAEAQCLEALALARGQRDWATYARVLLPLQEVRRHRRLIAAEGVVRLGTPSLPGDPLSWLDGLKTGCFVLTHPHRAQAARILVQAVRDHRLFVEVLLADNPATDQRWTLRSFAGLEVTCPMPAPPADWIDRPLRSPPPRPNPPGPWPRPADWFIDATEALGDAALAHVPPGLDPAARIAALERCLDVVSDHELIHQRLWDAARAAQIACG